jgi:hypothetical protein
MTTILASSALTWNLECIRVIYLQIYDIASELGSTSDTFRFGKHIKDLRSRKGAFVVERDDHDSNWRLRDRRSHRG